MKALFVELPPFERHRETYFDDGGFRALQALLMAEPEAGDVVEGTGGPKVGSSGCSRYSARTRRPTSPQPSASN